MTTYPSVVVFWGTPPGNDDYISIQLQAGGPPAQFGNTFAHDEGCGYAYETYSYEDGFVVLENVTGGNDCDGAYSREWTGRCHHSKLSANPAAPDDGKAHATPDWEEVGAVVTDAYAQAAGY